MNCRQADKWIDQALDGALAAGPQALLESHLAGCPQCRKEWEVLRAADAALRAPRPVRAPQGLLSEFRERLAQEEAQQERLQESRRRAWPWFWPVASFAAAGATAAMVIAFNLAPPGSPISREAPPARSDMARTPSRDPEIAAPRFGPPTPAAPPRTAKLKPPAASDLALLPPRPRLREPATPDRDRVRSLNLRPDGLSTAFRGERSDGVREATEGAAAGVRTPRLEAAAGAAGPPPPAAPPTVLTAANFERRVALRNGNVAPAPIALEADVQQAQSEVLPPEFNVSPAVLTALRRDVEVSVATLPVRDALRQITETADVVVKIDPAVQPLRVTVEQDGEPLWIALQKVAQQGKLQIVPEENHLVLRPEKAPARGLAGGAGALRYAQPLPTEPAKPGVGLGKKFGRFVNETPDRAVWPADWGTLPERGFEPPAPEDLPPAVAALPQAMDEARLENRSYQFKSNLEPGKGRGGDPKKR